MYAVTKSGWAIKMVDDISGERLRPDYPVGSMIDSHSHYGVVLSHLRDDEVFRTTKWAPPGFAPDFYFLPVTLPATPVCRPTVWDLISEDDADEMSV